jgi:hypothetical protein
MRRIAGFSKKYLPVSEFEIELTRWVIVSLITDTVACFSDNSGPSGGMAIS